LFELLEQLAVPIYGTTSVALGLAGIPVDGCHLRQSTHGVGLTKPQFGSSELKQSGLEVHSSIDRVALPDGLLSVAQM
ncbi:MAG: hypothetical protein ACJARS_002655, partial [bacterium]